MGTFPWATEALTGSIAALISSGLATTAAELGLQPEDTIVAIDGNATPEWEDLVAALESRAGEVIDVTGGVCRELLRGWGR